MDNKNRLVRNSKKRRTMVINKIFNYKIIFIVNIFIISIKVKAQQLPLYNQYNFNDFIYNPAFSGYSKEFSELSFLHRKQWSGVYGSPNTTLISFNSSKSANNIGYSGYAYHDKSGYIYITSIYGSYSYNTVIFDDFKIGAGLGLGLNLMGLDVGVYNKYTQNDIILNQNLGTTPRLTLDAGIFMSYYGFDLGFSAPNLISGIIKSSEMEERIYRLKRLYISSLKYTKPLNLPFLGSFNGDILLKPLFIMRILEGAPQSYEIHTLLDIKKLGWINVGYKGGFNSAKPILGEGIYIGEADIFAGVGYNINQSLSIGYTFGTGITKTLLNQGTNHEILMLYKLSGSQDVKKLIEKELKQKEDEKMEYMNALEKRYKMKQDSLEKQLRKDIVLNQNDINDLREQLKKTGNKDFDVIEYVPPRNLDNIKTPQENTFVEDDPLTMPDRVVAGSKGYYIVVGAFKFRENAEKRGMELTRKGFQNSIFYSEDNQMYYVFLRKYNDYNKAVYMRGNNLNGKYKKDMFEGDQLWIKEVR